MSKYQPNLSISTLLEASSLMGLSFDNRLKIQDNQVIDFVTDIQNKTQTFLDSDSKKKLFFVTALDFINFENNNQLTSGFLEINGSGFSGIANISNFAISSIVNELTNMPLYINDEIPVAIVPCSGSQAIKTSGVTSLIYEKILYAQSIKEGFIDKFGSGSIVSLYDLIKYKDVKFTKPTVIVGYLMDLMGHLTCHDGRMHIFNHPISVALHDRFSDNVVNAHSETIDPGTFYSVNSIYPITSDKGMAYTFYNDFIKDKSYRFMKSNINFTRVYSREELINQLLENNKSGLKSVIKPHAAALGRGIEFFLGDETINDVVSKIDDSIKATNYFCGVSGWAFPYTICEYIDCSTVPNPDSLLYKHKYELRIIVYRENLQIKAFPSIVKVCFKKYDENNVDRLMLLNNIAASAGKSLSDGSNFMLPLSNPETVKLLGMSPEHIEELCKFSCDFVKYTINRIEQQSGRLKEYYKDGLHSSVLEQSLLNYS